MASRTVLELVQTILTEMGSDEVNSISDTIEATDVATILGQVYGEMVDELSLPSTLVLRPLEALSDTDRPNMMKIPDECWNLKWIKYNDTLDGVSNFRDISYITPFEMVSMCNGNPSTDTDNYLGVNVFPNTLNLTVGKKKGPSYWTSFDDEFIFFDSYNSDEEGSMQDSKSQAYMETRPSLVLDDDVVPDIPQNQENTLYIRALSRCLSDKQDKINPKIERQESRMNVRNMRNRWRQGRQSYKGPNYGR